MPTITIDDTKVKCRDGVSVLQAALEAGWAVPHYCYHPGLSVVASCRICLMEQKMPHPKTGELEWVPKLFPSCQTPVKDGMVVRFASEAVTRNQNKVMEFLLLNHPLDCPTCDQAGECLLQDYSEEYGSAESRMVDEKHKTPKKDIGPRSFLYTDRCILCTRCIRFCQEIAGTNELCQTKRGSKTEIDCFPGKTLSNPLQGNVVDVCPVGAFLDKDFLFVKRVWMLDRVESVCPGCSAGCTIFVDSFENEIKRLKPRYNPGVNDWWMCDEGRFGWKFVHDEKRIRKPIRRAGNGEAEVEFPAALTILNEILEGIVQRQGPKKLALVLSPFLACEEAWMLIRYIRSIAPEAVLSMMPEPLSGHDQHFPVGSTAEDAVFTIRGEKCPNRRGVETLLANAGGDVVPFDEFVKQAKAGAFEGAWIAGGNPNPEFTDDFLEALDHIHFSVVQDILPNAATNKASLVMPMGAWVEREGTFMNPAGKLQPFRRAIAAPDGSVFTGQYLFDLAGLAGLYTGQRVRTLMAQEDEIWNDVYEAPEPPEHAH